MQNFKSFCWMNENLKRKKNFWHLWKFSNLLRNYFSNIIYLYFISNVTWQAPACCMSVSAGGEDERETATSPFEDGCWRQSFWRAEWRCRIFSQETRWSSHVVSMTCKSGDAGSWFRRWRNGAYLQKAHDVAIFWFLLIFACMPWKIYFSIWLVKILPLKNDGLDGWFRRKEEKVLGLAPQPILDSSAFVQKIAPANSRIRQ